MEVNNITLGSAGAHNFGSKEIYKEATCTATFHYVDESGSQKTKEISRTEVLGKLTDKTTVAGNNSIATAVDVDSLL